MALLALWAALVFTPLTTTSAQLTDVLEHWPQPPRDGSSRLAPFGLSQAEFFADALTGFLMQEEEGPAAALPYFRRALEKDPTQATLAIQTALEILRLGDVPLALSLLEDAALSNPKAWQPDYLLAEIYLFQLNRPAQATIHARHAASKTSQDFAPWRLLWQILRQQNRLGEAAQVLHQASALATAPAAFHLDFAALLANEDDTLSPSEKDTLLVEALEKAITRAPDDALVLERAADLHAIAGRPVEASGLYGQALGLASPSAGLLQKAGHAALAAGQPQEATERFLRLTKILPQSPSAWELLAQAASLADNQLTLEKALLTLTTLRQQHPQPAYELAAYYLSRKRWEDARSAIQAALERFAHDGLLHYFHARTLLRLKRHHEAALAFANALECAPISRANYLGGEFYFEFAMAAEQSGDEALAAELFKKAAAIDPSLSAKAANYIGYMWAERGENLEEAEVFIRQALAAEPSNPAYLDSLGWVQHQKGRHAEALSLLMEAHALSPEPEPVILEHLGDVWLALGRHDQALLFWEKALALEPEKQSLQQKLENLKTNPPTREIPFKSGRSGLSQR